MNTIEVGAFPDRLTTIHREETHAAMISALSIRTEEYNSFPGAV